MFRTFAALLPYLKRHAGFYAAGLACLLVTNTGQLLIPQWLKTAVNHLTSAHPEQPVIGGLVAAIVATALGVALARVGWRFFLTGASRRIEQELRQDLTDHLLTLPPSFYARQTTGDLMARATNDVDAVRNSIGLALVAFTDAVFISGSILVILFVQNPGLGLLIVSPLPVITVLIVVLGRLVGARFKAVQESYSALSEFAQEHLAGNRVIKAFTQEARVDGRFLDANLRYREANMKLVKLWGFFFPVITALAGISGLILLYVGGRAVMAGRHADAGRLHRVSGVHRHADLAAHGRRHGGQHAPARGHQPQTHRRHPQDRARDPLARAGFAAALAVRPDAQRVCRSRSPTVRACSTI